ncbi:MAG: hypothetical protein OXE75_12005 [bacterium]|nr:hypothetical protein [bacterium]
METGNLDLIITLVSIIGTVITAFGFLHREMRRGFDRVDQKFDRVDQKFDRIEEKLEVLGERLSGVDVRLARVEGHVGIGIPAPAEQRAGDQPPERAA